MGSWVRWVDVLFDPRVILNGDEEAGFHTGMVFSVSTCVTARVRGCNESRDGGRG